MGFYTNNIFPWILDICEPKEMAEKPTGESANINLKTRLKMII